MHEWWSFVHGQDITNNLQCFKFSKCFFRRRLVPLHTARQRHTEDKCALLGKGVCNLVFCVYACTGRWTCSGTAMAWGVWDRWPKVAIESSWETLKLSGGGYRRTSLHCFVLSVEALCVFWSYFPDYLLYPAYATAFLYYMSSLMHTLEIQKETAQC